jgi:mannose-6-phosphate isomerase-like protein (cupin superfamily)
MNENVFSALEEISKLEEMEFQTLAMFNSGSVGVFWSEAGGQGPWEMHPDCEEFLMVLEGAIELEILPEGGGPAKRRRLCSGELTVIPRRCWHRHLMLEKTKELYLTPGPTQHSHDEDPRQV